MAQPLTVEEAHARTEAERVIKNPEATPSGQIIDRQEPQAAPVQLPVKHFD